MTRRFRSGRVPKLVALIIAVSLVAVALGGCGQRSSSTSYPTQDIVFLVSFKAGGSFDIQARLLAPYIQKYLPNQVNVVVENEPAAATKVATLKLFDAKPDGYTMAILNVVALSTLYALGGLEDRVPANLTALARVNFAPWVLLMKPDSRFKSFADMKGQKVRIGGTGSAYLQSVLFAQAIGAECVFVSYDGLPETVLSVQRGDVDAATANWDSAVKHINASDGQLVPVVAFAKERIKAFLDVPTAAELGIQIEDGLLGLMASQSVVVAPPNVPEDTLAILEDAVTKAVNDPAFLADAEKAGYSLVPLGPEDTKDIIFSVSEFVMQHKDALESQ